MEVSQRPSGMSKSGLYGHFGSKEELQLATINAAQEVFDAVVINPALQRMVVCLLLLVVRSDSAVGQLRGCSERQGFQAVWLRRWALRRPARCGR